MVQGHWGHDANGAELVERPDDPGDGEQFDGAPHVPAARPGVDGGDEVTGETGSGEDERERRTGRRALRALAEWVVVIGGALLVAFLVKTFLVQAFWIPSPSMADTLVKGDRVLVNKLADSIGDINRGDVIVFKRPQNGNPGHPEGQIQDLIKRVVGLPGDVIESRDGALYVNDRRLDEPYLDEGMRTELEGSVTVPEGHVFVMGDNRVNSHDSRNFGPIPDGDIVGRAFLRVWPPSNVGRL